MTYSSNSYFRQLPILDYPSLANDRTSSYDYSKVKGRIIGILPDGCPVTGSKSQLIKKLTNDDPAPFEIYDKKGFTNNNKTSRYLDVIIYTYIIVSFLSFWIQQKLILF